MARLTREFTSLQSAGRASAARARGFLPGGEPGACAASGHFLHRAPRDPPPSRLAHWRGVSGEKRPLGFTRSSHRRPPINTPLVSPEPAHPLTFCPDSSDGVPHPRPAAACGAGNQMQEEGGSPGTLRDTTPGLATRGQTHVPGPREAGAGQGVASQYRPEPERRREPLTLTARAPTLCPTPSCPHPAESQTRGTGDKGLSSAGRDSAPPLHCPPSSAPSRCSPADGLEPTAEWRGLGVRESSAPGGNREATARRPAAGCSRGVSGGARLLSGPLP